MRLSELDIDKYPSTRLVRAAVAAVIAEANEHDIEIETLAISVSVSDDARAIAVHPPDIAAEFFCAFRSMMKKHFGVDVAVPDVLPDAMRVGIDRIRERDRRQRRRDVRPQRPSGKRKRGR